ncbi:MAG: glycosyltransferase family 2 protein [Hespellia sp.]|nr:glycosyltransferase family 2 protein [Hespellia sp.]
MQKLSIIVPCYNESDTVEVFYEELTKVEQTIEDMEFELIFVNDGSKDDTFEILERMHQNGCGLKAYSFSRNFGKEAAMFAGLHKATGDCCIVMDADLQHPPAVIPKMVELWRQGYEVVEGTKIDRGKESVAHKLFAKMFYSLMNKCMGMDMSNSSDFKLLDRKVIDILCALKERNTFFRALSFWVGFRSTIVEYETQERIAGSSKWSYFSLIKYALSNVVSFTFWPLYLINVIGAVLLVVGAGMGIDAVISFFRGHAIDGYPSLVILMWLATGGIMSALGIIGIYIAKIYDELKARPQYIIDGVIE